MFQQRFTAEMTKMITSEKMLAKERNRKLTEGTGSHHNRSSRGFTLLEVMLVLAVLAVVLGIVGGILKAYFGMLFSFLVERENIAEARAAMEAIVDVLDEARRERKWTLEVDPTGTKILGREGEGEPHQVLSIDEDHSAECRLYRGSDRSLYRYDENEGDWLEVAKYVDSLEVSTVLGTDIKPYIDGGSEVLELPDDAVFLRVTVETDKEGSGEAACRVTTYVYSGWISD